MPDIIDEPSLRVLAQLIGREIARDVADAVCERMRSAPAPVLPEYYNTKQAADFTGYTVEALDTMRCRGVGPPFKRMGGKYNPVIRYRVSDLRAWVEENSEEVRPQPRARSPRAA